MMKMFMYWIEYIVFISFVRLFQFLGIKKSRQFIKIFSLFVYYFIPIRKKVILKNLKIAFNDKSEREIKQIMKLSYFSNFLTFMELFLFEKFNSKEILSLVKFEDEQILKAIVDSNNGAILLTAHFGNWELAANAFSIFTNKRLSVIYKKMHNPYINDWLVKVRDRFNKSVPLGLTLKEVIIELQNKNLVGIVADQRAPKEAKLKVNFFNTRVTAYEGPAALAIKYKIPIFFVITYRNKDYSYNFVIKKIDIDYNKPNNENILLITQQYYDLLESLIKKFPEQWFWLHNRWKHLDI